MRLTRRMLKTQVRLAVKSVKVIARDVEVAREFPRLLKTGGRSTTSLAVPWLPFRLIDELAEIIAPATRVFEYGGGGSSLWFLSRGAEVVTVEHHAEWSDRLESMIESPRWTLIRAGEDHKFDNYVASIGRYEPNWFDIVIVDGRERVRCALTALEMIRPGGLLIFDDVDRERYQEGLASIQWPRRDFVGFAPAKPTLAYTAVFTRPTADV